MPFDGNTYDRSLDGKRLTAQIERVKEVMRDGQWRSLAGIKNEIKHRFDNIYDSEAAISARLRDFRKDKFGAYQVHSRRTDSGLWEYSLDIQSASPPKSDKKKAKLNWNFDMPEALRDFKAVVELAKQHGYQPTDRLRALFRWIEAITAQKS